MAKNPPIWAAHSVTLYRGVHPPPGGESSGNTSKFTLLAVTFKGKGALVGFGC